MKISAKRLTLLLVICLFPLVIGGCTGKSGPAPSDAQQGEKKGILVVSFGTSYADARAACIDSVVKDIAEAYPDYDVRQAFTSQIIIDKLAERDNIKYDNPEQALAKMKKEGFTEVIVQPLHIIPGLEFNDIEKIVSKYNDSFKKLALGQPILSGIEDYRSAVNALKNQLPALSGNEAVVLVGHGTEHYANACYSCLQSFLQDEGLSVFVGTIEGYPDLDDVIKKLKAKNIKAVTLMPFMLVAGDHAQNDIAGDEEDSWKNILKKEGFMVSTYDHGLGENQAFRAIYVNNVKKAIDKSTKSK